MTRMRFFEERVRQRLAELGRDSYEQLIEPAGQPVHRRTQTVTHRVDLPGGEPGEPAAVFIKVYRPNLGGWKFILRPSKPWSEARNLRRLAEWGVPVVRVAGTGSRRTWYGRLVDAFLATEDWGEGVTLAHYAREHWPIRGAGPLPFRDFRVLADGPLPPTERDAQQAIGRLLADALRLMHRHHFYHIDLQWRNVLVRRGPGGDWQVALLDCPRGERRWTIPGQQHGRVSDLASLDRLAGVYLTRSERLRWLRDYLGQPKLEPAGRRLARRVCAYRSRFERRRGRGTGARPGARPEPLAPARH